MTDKKLHNPYAIGIAVITSYPKWYQGKVRSVKHTDKIRGDMALASAKKAAEIGYTLVVADGKSSKSFRRELKLVPGVRMSFKRIVSRGPAKRKVLQMASRIKGVQVLVLTELEKYSLIADCLPILVEPILKNQADIVVPKRDEELFEATYPYYMYESETEGNILYNQMLRVKGLLLATDEDLDMFFGPRVFANKQKVKSLFLKAYTFKDTDPKIPKEYFDAEQFSNTLYFPIVAGLYKKIKVKSVTVPFQYPELQKENEEKGRKKEFMEKRKTQFMGILVELIHFLSYLEKQPQSKLQLLMSR